MSTGLVALCEDVLAAVVAGYSTASRSLPTRRYYTVGTPVNDCEQLVVSYIQHYLGTPGDEASAPLNCNVPRSAVLQVSLVRAMPIVHDDAHPPTAAEIQDASSELLTDAYLLVDTLADTDPTGLGVIVTCEVGDVSGGLGTVVAQIVLGVP